MRGSLGKDCPSGISDYAWYSNCNVIKIFLPKQVSYFFTLFKIDYADLHTFFAEIPFHLPLLFGLGVIRIKPQNLPPPANFWKWDFLLKNCLRRIKTPGAAFLQAATILMLEKNYRIQRPHNRPTCVMLKQYTILTFWLAHLSSTSYRQYSDLRLQ
jgi:hypothetical protein